MDTSGSCGMLGGRTGKRPCGFAPGPRPLINLPVVTQLVHNSNAISPERPSAPSGNSATFHSASVCPSQEVGCLSPWYRGRMVSQPVPWRACRDCGWGGGLCLQQPSCPPLPAAAHAHPGDPEVAALQPQEPRGLPGLPVASGPGGNYVDAGVCPLRELTQWNHLNACWWRGGGHSV